MSRIDSVEKTVETIHQRLGGVECPDPPRTGRCKHCGHGVGMTLEEAKTVREDFAAMMNEYSIRVATAIPDVPKDEYE
ncbi:MAG TPA: hypothetical protein ENH00_03220 [Actinobacteria bacterium]|nr:hypothetical protein [Actinomycetota bacterium]